jgi:hypothetical protein
MHDARFIVRDKNRQALGYFYYDEEPHRRFDPALASRRISALRRRAPRLGADRRRPAALDHRRVARLFSIFSSKTAPVVGFT